MNTHTAKNLASTKWHKSLRFSLLIVYLLCITIAATAVIYIVKKNASERIFANSRAYTIEKGQAVVNRVGQQVTYIEGIAKTLAHIVETSPNRPQLMHELVPNILEDGIEQSIIAGGGIWPEPFSYNPTQSRNSFFWGRDSEGKLKLINDYNSPEGRGYHNEEWYVPAKHYTERTAYWSQSYMDPFSLEPMVTCAVPYTKDGAFSGVITVDVKLKGLQEMFAKEAKAFSGYIFAVDRNNRFLSYPQKDLATVGSQETSTQPVSYVTSEQMHIHVPDFTETHEQLQQLLIQKRQNKRALRKVRRLSQTLDHDSDQINEDYAHLIALEILNPNTGEASNHLTDFTVQQDPIFKTDSFNIVFEVPRTYWKLVVVAPLEQLVLPAYEFTYELLPPLLATSIICLLITMLATHRLVISPIHRITQQIDEERLAPSAHDTLISYTSKNELGQLVERFNKHTESLTKARQQAEIALQTKRDFMANISHEIRTPMNGILLSSEALMSKDIPAEEVHYAEIIQQSSLDLISIIDEILDCAKLDSNKLTLEYDDFDAHQLVSEISELFRASAEQKHLKLDTNLERGTHLRLRGDRKRLRQIISNVVGNAVKFTQKGFVHIDLSYSETNATLQIRVSDSGIGIAPGQQQHIFDQFSQADTSITRDFGGTGLGLNISQQLCKLMQGEITVESQAGTGSSFTITIPAARAQQQAPVDAPVKEHSVLFKPFQGELLLVDDNKINQLLATRILKSIGFEITTASNGQEAIEQFSTKHFDLILMDLQMPIVDGLTATQHIRAMPHPNHLVPIIALTAAVDAAMQNECQQRGMQGFISKPYNTPLLIKEIERVLAYHAQHQAVTREARYTTTSVGREQAPAS